ncbi:MAG: transposase, partial [Gammaproteobacteria bacterium]|nr:transposase [Gammaproteobacteria bacterium]
MSNHYHVVLHVDKQQADNWSNKEICTRWAELFSGNDLAKRYLKNEILSAVEEQLL